MQERTHNRINGTEDHAHHAELEEVLVVALLPARDESQQTHAEYGVTATHA
jgi:hypothetical protein